MAEHAVTVYDIGSSVKVGPDHTIEGLVTGVCIRSVGHVQYEVSYWQNGARQSAWMEVPEVRGVDVANVMRIGFTKPEPCKAGRARL